MPIDLILVKKRRSDTMAKTGFGADKTVIKSMGFCSFGSGSNTAEIDVKDGKILRTRPLDLIENIN